VNYLLNKEPIEVLLSSDDNYNELVVEIFYNGKFVALVHQKNGIENLVIEFSNLHIQKELILKEINFSTFEKALQLAKKRLLNISTSSENHS
jgi:endonuclease YncB( thermonuclease family)